MADPEQKARTQETPPKSSPRGSLSERKPKLALPGSSADGEPKTPIGRKPKGPWGAGDSDSKQANEAPETPSIGAKDPWGGGGIVAKEEKVLSIAMTSEPQPPKPPSVLESPSKPQFQHPPVKPQPQLLPQYQSPSQPPPQLVPQTLNPKPQIPLQPPPSQFLHVNKTSVAPDPLPSPSSAVVQALSGPSLPSPNPVQSVSQQGAAKPTPLSSAQPEWTGPSPLPSFASDARAASPSRLPQGGAGQLGGLLDSLRDQVGQAFRQPLMYPPHSMAAPLAGWPPVVPNQYMYQDGRTNGAGPAGGIDLEHRRTSAQTDHEKPRSVRAPSKTWIGLDFSELQKDFRHKMEAAQTRLIPELQQHRENVLYGQQATEAKAEQVRQIVSEAERDGRQEFESLREHLRSVESLKLAVLGQDQHRRSQTIKGIDELVEKIKRAGSVGFNGDGMAAFVKAFPGIQADTDTLLSKPAASQIEVGFEDIPFEARARKDKLKKFAVMALLHRAKDQCLWQVEQQRRVLEKQNRHAEDWQRHLELLLDRYASNFAYTCYFCAAPFEAITANSPCNYNIGVSHRTGHLPAPDTQVPHHLRGAGVHYWVPSNGRGVDVAPRVPTPPPLWQPAGMSEAMRPPSDPLPRPRPVVPVPMAQPVPVAPPAYNLDAFAATVLRRIAIICQQHQVNIQDAFRAFDANGDGFVSVQEFRHAVSRLKLGLTENEIDSVLRRLDINADGMVSYEEFLTLMYYAAGDQNIANVGGNAFQHFMDQDFPAQEMWQKVAGAIQDRGIPLHEAFSLFDADGDGVVSGSELKDAFKAMKLELTDHDINRLMRAIDVNEDGRISIHEFVNRLHHPAL